MKIHVIVLETFVGLRPKGYHACHNDGIKGNNHVDNLRWDTPKGNMSDKIKHGTLIYGKKHRWYGRTVSDEERKRTSELMKKRSAMGLNPMFNKTHTKETREKISRILKANGSCRGENNYKARLNELQVRIIKKLIKLGVPNVDIGVVFETPPVTISHIKTGRTWSYV